MAASPDSKAQQTQEPSLGPQIPRVSENGWQVLPPKPASNNIVASNGWQVVGERPQTWGSDYNKPVPKSQRR